MAAYKHSPRNYLPLLFLLTLGGVGLTSWGTWRSRQPTHRIAQVPEPYRSQLHQSGTVYSRDLNQLDRWRTWAAQPRWPSFSQDGQYLLLSLGTTLRLYEVNTGRLVRQWSLPITTSSQRVHIQLFSAPNENRWYTYSSAVDVLGKSISSLGQKVYSVTPDQAELGEPLPGLESVHSISPSGRYLLGGSTDKIQLHDRQSGKTLLLANTKSDTLHPSGLLFDPDAPQLYGYNLKSKCFLFFDLATGKRVPTPEWLTRSGAHYCRFFKETVFTGHDDGTVRVRSRQSPDTILKTYPTPIRHFSRMRITRDQIFILAEGVDNKGLTKGMFTTFFTVALDTQGKGREKVFGQNNPPQSNDESRTEEEVQFAWGGSYLLTRRNWQGNKLLNQGRWISMLSTGAEIKLPWDLSFLGASLSPEGKHLAWMEPLTGDLMLWQVPR